MHIIGWICETTTASYFKSHIYLTFVLDFTLSGHTKAFLLELRRKFNPHQYNFWKNNLLNFWILANNSLQVVYIACLGKNMTDLKCYRSTVETCVKWPLKNRRNKGLMTKCSLMKVESIAECNISTFDLHLAIIVLEKQFSVFLRMAFYTGFTVQSDWEYPFLTE